MGYRIDYRWMRWYFFNNKTMKQENDCGMAQALVGAEWART
jgi:hypothetical protein